MRPLAILLTLALAGQIVAQPPTKPTKADHDAAAAIALAKVKIAATSNLTRELTLEQGLAVAKSKRIPVFVRVGALDCSSLCAELRPEIPTVHTATMNGDNRPRVLLLQADDSGAVWKVQEWPNTLPTISEVKAAAKVAPVKAREAAEAEKRKATVPTAPTKPSWLSQPLNVGRCPCGPTGGCRCNPHSDCAAGKCATHNPYLIRPTAPPMKPVTVPVPLDWRCVV